MSGDAQELYGLLPSELGQLLGGSGRAREVWALIRAGRDPFEEGALGARAQHELNAHCERPATEIVERRTAECGTTKLLLRLGDGVGVETVVIPGRGRSTVCVSTQVGCARGCTFCVTATMGLIRSLSAAEIVAQVLVARTESRRLQMPPLRNVVTMGMGEPLDNLEATKQSIAILLDPHALAVAPRHLTLSTIGTSPRAIRALADLPVCLAWSLHSVDEQQRRALIPNSRHSLLELRDAFFEVVRSRNDVLFIEMTLLDGINDSEQEAHALADFVEPLGSKVRVNLLPMNPGRAEHSAASPARIEAFNQALRERGVFCMVRQARGAEAAAACGQLAVPAWSSES